jgi:hypothetical protein
MVRSLVRVLGAGLVAVLLLIGMMGCGGTKRLGRYDLVVTPEDSLRDASRRMPLVEVDLIGVAENDVPNWMAQGVDQHFSGENQLRRDAKDGNYLKTLVFSQDDSGAKTLKASDPIWGVWQKRGVTTLFVFASARTFKVAPGGPDRRRLSIPLTTDKWEGSTRQIDLVLRASGVDCATAMKVEK